MSCVLLTGAFGFTGHYVAEALKARGHGVIGIGSRKPEQPNRAFEASLSVDIRDAQALKRILKDVQPDAIIHLAGIAFVGHDDVSEIYSTNVLATRNLLQAARECAPASSPVILASSANIYGNRTEGMLSEDAPVDPANDYAVSKAAMELVAGLFANDLPIIIARPFNYTGLGQPTEFLIPKIVEHARRRADCIELGNIEVARDFSDVRMIADSYVRLLEQPEAIGKAINLCSGRCFTLREIIETVTTLSGHTMKIEVNPRFVRANDVRVMRGNPTLLQSLIGPIESPPIEETLSWMLKG